MKRVYLDNAATTPLDEAVFESMKPYLLEHFGNPSSIHHYGRIARSAIEKARKSIAELLSARPSEIFFTSGGTEADNLSILSAIEAFNLKHAITSKLEHHAVLHPLEDLIRKNLITLDFLDNDEQGQVDLAHLEEILKKEPSTIVSLMHGNNEIGNLNDIQKIGEMVGEYGGYFQSDTVQTIGHFNLDVTVLGCHALVGSAHKFHGPKGVGFIYINSEKMIPPQIRGGAQERNMRAGTENVAGIVGMAKALELSMDNLEQDREKITALKSYMINQMKKSIPGISINGLGGQFENSLYTVLNIRLPASVDPEMLLFNLDIKQIAASAGSACTSGTNIGSHVLQAINVPDENSSIRFSFSKFNTKEEIDYVVKVLAELTKEKDVK